MALLQAIVMQSDRSSLCCQRHSLNAAEGPVTEEDKKEMATCKRSEAVQHAMSLLSLQYFSSLHAVLARDSLNTLAFDKFLESDAVKQLQSTALDLRFVLTSFSQEVF